MIGSLNVTGLHVCSFRDPLDYRIYVGGKLYRFEFSERFGPALLGKRGDVLEGGRIRERHPFWLGFNPWLNQGKRVDAWTGLCVWHEPKPTFFRRMVGRQYQLVRGGEPYGRGLCRT